ncbi:unnamed protein product [Closterium sp. NIES-54]
MFSLIGDSDAVVANLAWACRRECAVCLGEYAAGERIKVVPACAHGFHADCIDLWLAAKTTCPICRRDLSAGEAAEAEGVTDGEVAEGMGAEGMGAAAAPAEAAAEAAASPAAAAPAAETAVAANLVYSSSSSTASSSRRAAAAAAAVEMESDTVTAPATTAAVASAASPAAAAAPATAAGSLFAGILTWRTDFSNGRARGQKGKL